MNELLYFGSIMMSIMSILQMASVKYNRIIQNPPDLSQKYTENVNSLTASLVQLGFNLLALTSSWIPGSWSLRHGHSRSNNQSGLKTVNPEEFSAADSFIQRWEERNIYIYFTWTICKRDNHKIQHLHTLASSLAFQGPKWQLVARLSHSLSRIQFFHHFLAWQAVAL